MEHSNVLKIVTLGIYTFVTLKNQGTFLEGKSGGTIQLVMTLII